MGNRKATPSFGHVDLDIGDEVAGHGAAPPKSVHGRVDPRLEDEDAPAEPAPPSTSRVFNAEGRPAGVRARATSVHDESTRIVAGDALALLSRPPPAGHHDDGATRAWADIDNEHTAADEPPSSRSGHQSASGVAARGDGLAAMRELYARGDAAGALALAATISHAVALPSSAGAGDSPDASIVVEFGEHSIDLDDPFGGLLFVEEPAEESAPLSRASATRTVPPPAAKLTLTERQSIPRRLTALADMSKLKIDHRAGFLLAHIDGMQTLEEILDVCAMPAEEALASLANLKALGVIEFE